MLGVLAVDKPQAVLRLMLKAEQAAIKTISPLEWSWRGCLLLFKIPPGACSHFLSFTSLSSFPGSLPPSAPSLSLVLWISVQLMIYPLTFPFFSHPVFFIKKKNVIPLYVRLFFFCFYSFLLCVALSPCLLPTFSPFKVEALYCGLVESLSAQWSLSNH